MTNKEKVIVPCNPHSFKLKQLAQSDVLIVNNGSRPIDCYSIATIKLKKKRKEKRMNEWVNLGIVLMFCPLKQKYKHWT